MTTVNYELNDSTAIIALDDGKANVFGHDMIDALTAALDRAVEEANAVAIIGREGKLSGGFDLGVMQESPEAARNLVTAGADLFLKIFTLPRPVVVGCTGHAVAAGAILLLSADTRIGSDAPCKIGLNEVSIGMPVPVFAVELARHRLSTRHFPAAVGEARLYDGAGAAEVGYLDSVVAADTVADAAVAHATELAGRLHPSAFAATRTNIRGAAAADMTARMYDDLAAFTIG